MENSFLEVKETMPVFLVITEYFLLYFKDEKLEPFIRIVTLIMEAHGSKFQRKALHLSSLFLQILKI